ncbi:molybdate ABC transporter permease subunit [Baekduia soli]|uniref:Molybdenum transport system permease n=1 Tax=Baekduia soli TaxID=496014 RepID=A0A5B8U8T5_9ACTN|nr:molybdate ABC transporter permease subunit [Baekduia soli]QEC49198.1 molybdate ABC transporter permease subunit [Baekduia soli]
MTRRAGTALALGVVVAFLVVPVAALLVEAPLGRLPSLLGTRVVRDAIWVTVRANLAANALVLGFGTPAAWLLATRRFPGRALVLTLCELPLVLPPAVAGIALLSAYAQGGLFGDALQRAGVVLPFGPWAVVLAVAFVASPFYLRQAVAAFEAVDGDLTDVARTLGASRTRTFWRVVLPLASGGLVAGWVLAFARGVGEFGATIIFAGNVQGRTTTLTLAVYQELDSNLDVAVAMGVLLVALSAGVLLSYKLLETWRSSTSTSRVSFAPSPSS